MDENTENPNQSVVEIVPEDKKVPTYANAFRAIYTPYDFEMIFAHVSRLNSTRENELEARLTARIAIQPILAKRTLQTLQQAIENYEKDFGEIKEIEDDLHHHIHSEKQEE